MTRKTAFFEGWSWFKFNNLGLALDTNLKFYTSVVKGLKLKFRKFGGLVSTLVEVTGENLVERGGPFCSSSQILNRVNSAPPSAPPHTPSPQNKNPKVSLRSAPQKASSYHKTAKIFVKGLVFSKDAGIQL